MVMEVVLRQGAVSRLTSLLTGTNHKNSPDQENLRLMRAIKRDAISSFPFQ